MTVATNGHGVEELPTTADARRQWLDGLGIIQDWVDDLNVANGELLEMLDEDAGDAADLLLQFMLQVAPDDDRYAELAAACSKLAHQFRTFDQRCRIGDPDADAVSTKEISNG